MLQIARRRASGSKYIGFSFCIIAVIIIISEYIKYVYLTNPGIFAPFISPFTQYINSLYADHALFRGIWTVSPNPSLDMPIPFFNLAGLTALSFLVVGGWIRDRAVRNLRMVAQAEHILTLHRLAGTNVVSQSIGNVHAAGDITINQINQARETEDKLTHGFRDGPLWSLVTGIVFPLIVTLIGHLFGLQ